MSDIEVREGELAFAIDKEIDELIQFRNKAIFEIGKRLKTIKDGRIFTTLGYDSFDAYSSSKKFRPSTARAYVHIYEEFICRLRYGEEELELIPWGRLQLIVPKIKENNKDEIDEWLSKARELSFGDFRAEVEEGKLIGEKKPYPKAWLCKNCHKWVLSVDKAELCSCV